MGGEWPKLLRKTSQKDVTYLARDVTVYVEECDVCGLNDCEFLW